MVGKGIKWVRNQRGLSQTELARRMGSSQSNLSQVEGDLRDVSAAFLDRLAEELEVHLIVFHWMGIEREDIDESVRTKFDILKPSIDQLFKEIFF